MPDGDDGKSQGVAFILVESEAKAILAAKTLNGFALDKKHTLAACQFDEFEKIQNVPDELVMPSSSDLLDLKSPFLDLKQDQYLYQIGRDAYLNWHNSSQFQNQKEEGKQNRVVENPIRSQKPVSWSP